MSLLDRRKPFLLSSIFSGSTSLSFTNFSSRLKVSSWKVQLQNTVSYAESSWKRVHVASYINHVSWHNIYLNASSNIVLSTSCSPHRRTCMTAFFSARVFHHLACLVVEAVGIGSFSCSAVTDVGTRIWGPCSLYEVLCPFWIKWAGIPKNFFTFFTAWAGEERYIAHKRL